MESFFDLMSSSRLALHGHGSSQLCHTGMVNLMKDEGSKDTAYDLGCSSGGTTNYSK